MSITSLEDVISPHLEEPTTNPNEKTWIRDRINEQVREAETRIGASISEQVRTAVESFKPKGWKKAFYILKELAPLGGIFSVVVALPAIIVGLVIAVSNWREADATFRANTENFQKQTEVKLGNIEAQLLELRASQSPKSVLKQINDLGPDVFAKALPALRKVAEQPDAEVNAQRPTLREVAEKLRNTSETTLDYWPTVLQFLSFASSSTATSGVPPATERPSVSTSGGGFQDITFLGKIVKIDGGKAINVTFRNCRIIFTDKPSTLYNTTFINCIFDMPVTSSPSPYLKRASQILLASDLTTVKMPSL